MFEVFLAIVVARNSACVLMAIEFSIICMLIALAHVSCQYTFGFSASVPGVFENGVSAVYSFPPIHCIVVLVLLHGSVFWF